MERDDPVRLSPDNPATVLIHLNRHHFASVGEAVRFALDTAPKDAWIITNCGLLGPEDLTRAAQTLFESGTPVAQVGS